MRPVMLRRPVTLATKLVLVCVSLVIVVAVPVSVATTLGMRAVLLERLDHDVTQGGRGPGPGPGQRSGLLVAYETNGDQAEGSYVSERGLNPPVSLTSAQIDSVRKVPVDDQVHTVRIAGLGTFRVQAREADSSGGEFILVNGMSTEQVESTLSSLMMWEVLLSLGGVLLAVLISTPLVRRTLAPLREVAGVAKEVTSLDLTRGSVGETVRVPERLTDERTEVGQVGASLNSLLGHMEDALDARHQSEQQVRQFLADASHELRTPLTTIRGYAEMSGRNPEVLSSAMEKVDAESIRMTSLVDDLLLLARLDSGRPLATDPVDLTRLVLDAVADARVVGQGHTWNLSLPDEPVEVIGDEQRLHQVITNLLNNARRHTPPGTTVRTSLARQPDRVQLRVHDNGPGIPEGLAVFERFSRGDRSRARESGGAGLGLSLVAAITESHGGRVSVDSRPGDTTFLVELPAAQA